MFSTAFYLRPKESAAAAVCREWRRQQKEPNSMFSLGLKIFIFISSFLLLFFSGFGVSMSSVDSAYIYTSSSSFLQRAESWTSVKCFPFRQVGKVPRKRVKFLTTTTFFTHFFFLLFSSHFIHSTSHLISSGVCSATTGQSSQLIYKIKSSQKSRDSDDSRERREWKMIKLFYFTQFTLSESELCARWCWCVSSLCSFFEVVTSSPPSIVFNFQFTCHIFALICGKKSHIFTSLPF